MKEFVRRHPILSVSAGIAAALFCLFWAVFILGRPLPPRTVVMTTGPEGGVYREHGEKYRAALARDGIEVKLLTSVGNVENLNRLKDPASGVAVGFVSGGLTSAEASPDVVSLGTIWYYPLARLVPAAIEFAVEQRLQNLYKELRDVDRRLGAGEPGVEKALQALEERVRAARVPAAHEKSLYTLKQHLALVRERLMNPIR